MHHNTGTQELLNAIGNTPLIRLCAVSEATGCDIYGKAEFMNPGGSITDRIALNMIEEAEKAGTIRPGDTLIEPTSGNTGVGLAIVAAQRGYNCIFVMTDKVSSEKVDLLRAYLSLIHI